MMALVPGQPKPVRAIAYGNTGWVFLYRSEAAWNAAARWRCHLCAISADATLSAAELAELEPALSPIFHRALGPGSYSVDDRMQWSRPTPACFRCKRAARSGALAGRQHPPRQPGWTVLGAQASSRSADQLVVAVVVVEGVLKSGHQQRLNAAIHSYHYRGEGRAIARPVRHRRRVCVVAHGARAAIVNGCGWTPATPRRTNTQLDLAGAGT